MSTRRIIVTIILGFAAIVAKFSWLFGLSLAAVVSLAMVGEQIVRIQQREHRLILLGARNAGCCLRDLTPSIRKESLADYRLLALCTAMYAVVWICLLPFAQFVGMVAAAIALMALGLILISAPFLILFGLAFWVADLFRKAYLVGRDISSIREHFNG